MPGGLSAAAEASVLATLTGSTSYISLHTGDPGVTGSLSEVSGNAYARVSIASAGWTTSGTGNPTTAQNNATLTYPPASPGGWGTVNYFGIWSALTGGTFLGANSMSSRTINAGDTARFAIGALTIQVD